MKRFHTMFANLIVILCIFSIVWTASASTGDSLGEKLIRPPKKPNHINMIIEPGDSTLTTKLGDKEKPKLSKRDKERIKKEKKKLLDKIKNIKAKKELLKKVKSPKVKAKSLVNTTETESALVESTLHSTPGRVLVTYDQPLAEYGKLGPAYGIMLRNLLGHFSLTVDLLPIEQYQAGDLENYDYTLYLGSYYDNPLPVAFLQDVLNTSKTVAWFKYNIWKLAWDPAANFAATYGFSFNGLAGLNAPPTPENPYPGFYDTVLYKDKSFVKYYSYDSATNKVFSDPDVGVTQITDASKAQQLITVKNAVSGAEIPYVVRSGNFWYIADIPFSYIGPRDRYLVFADLLHDILGEETPENHKALIRLEDVAAKVTQQSMKELSDYLSSQSVPFSIAVIPFYRDPLGFYTGGTPEEIHLAEATDLTQSLGYALAHGGKILMHGYTHQYDSQPNSVSGVSADDFEFWDIVENRPVDEDSESWVLARLDAGLAELQGSGYAPFAWEVPHYQASPIAYQTFPQRFDTTYQRAVYYTSDNPNLNPDDPNRDYAVGQFFPYIIYEDYYGQKVLPENLGNVEYPGFGGAVYTKEDILLNASYALVVRDGFASFFFHPFWLEPDLHVPGLADFKTIIEGITALGYQWLDASEL